MSIGAVLPPVLPASPFEGAVQITNPSWFGEQDSGGGLLDDEARAAFVDELGTEGYAQADGDGWASAIINEDTGAVVAAAVERELGDGYGHDLFNDPSVTALLFAQQRLGAFSLAGRPLVLVTNRPPTPLAFGQGTWSGVGAVLCPQADSAELARLYPGRETWPKILASSPSRTIVRHGRFQDDGPRPRREDDDWRALPRVVFVSQQAAIDTTESQPSPDWREGAVHLHAPSWLVAMAPSEDWVATTTEQRLGLAIDLSRRNIENGGGPFGAALYDWLGRVYAVGMNQVVPQRSSILHAEGMAYVRALARYWTEEYLQIESGGVVGVMGGLTLATSCDPCVQCYMATLALARSRQVGAGLVVRMDHAAHADDARAIGFDEGVLPARPGEHDGHWAILAERGVQVTSRALRDEASRVMQDYARSGGKVYNADAGAGKGPVTPT